MQKLRIAFHSLNPLDACSYYRNSGVLPYINSDKIEVIDLSEKDQLHHFHFINIDVMVFARSFTEEHLRDIKLAKQMGCKVIVDYDDNLFDIDTNNPTQQIFEYHRGATIQCMQEADEIWVTVDALKERYAELNSNIYVIPNAHNDYLFPVDKRVPFDISGRRVGYRGAVTHEIDLYEHLYGLIQTINQYPKWQFNFIGSRFPHLESKTGANHTMSNPMPLMDYFTHLQAYNPNLFFYPLQNNAFNKCKSNCSFLEATYAGAAFIGNEELPEFANSPIFSINGNLQRVFNIALNDHEMLFSMNDHAWQWILQNRLLSNINKLRERRLCAPKV